MTPLIEAKPHRLSLHWTGSAGFYVLATDQARRSFIDPDEAVAALCAAMDPRLNEMPLGSC